jgi:hypothetical protein
MYKNEETIKYNFLCNFYPHSNGGWIFFSKWFSLFSVYLSSNVCKTDLKTVKCCLKGNVEYLFKQVIASCYVLLCCCYTVSVFQWTIDFNCENVLLQRKLQIFMLVMWLEF